MSEWWREAVFYEIYVRSFADSDGDGVGDLPGIRSLLRYVRDLGVDGIWLTPFFPSPGVDFGYDVSDYLDVDPQFGTLSVFGGPAWSRDEERRRHYLHLFAREQPDLDWHNPAVRAEFERILRFWLDRGVDGCRIDVAHGLFKDLELRDEAEPVPGAEPRSFDRRTATDRPEVHPLYREWRSLADDYGDRILIGEVFLSDPERVAPYVRPDELHLAFNFALLWEPWDAQAMRAAIDATLRALHAVDATPSWVLENHDVVRLATRYGSRRRARAAALLLLALPGVVFVYQGQELGLEEVELADDQRVDPVFFRTGGERLGRDGSRIPMPWEREGAGLGFTSGASWLPIPSDTAAWVRVG